MQAIISLLGSKDDADIDLNFLAKSMNREGGYVEKIFDIAPSELSNQ